MKDKYIKIDLTEIDGKLIYKLNIIADRTDLLKYNLDTLKVFDDFIKVEADTSTGLAEIKASLYSYYHTIKLSDEIALNISYMNGLIFENELYRINGYGLLYGLTPVECDYTLKLEKNK